MKKPLCIDLFAGLGGWAHGFLAEGYDVVGFDIERHQYGDDKYPGQLVLQDVLTLDGRQFRTAAVIVASPPCQKYSYMAMPWKRAKEQAAWYREDPERQVELNALFDSSFRIQREASAAAGHRIPLIAENVRGAQPWVGRAGWNFGSFYLWGDIPALMPKTFTHKLPKGHDTWAKDGRPCNKLTDPRYGSGLKNARNWWSDGAGSLSATTSSKSPARKAASAQIAKIPFPLAQHIARVFHP